MSLVMETGPSGQFRFTRIPLGLTITTTDRLTTAGVKYSITVTFLNYPTADGVTFSITWNGRTVTMLSMGAPITEDGAHYRKREGAFTLAQWIAQFAEDIGYNYYIGRDFDISYTTTTLTFTAKRTGSAYNLSAIDMPGTVVTHYTLGTPTDGVDEVEVTNYRILIDVCFGGTDIVPVEAFLTDTEPYDDVTGVYQAQIHKILHKKIGGKFPVLNEIGSVMFSEAGDIIKKFWLRYYAVSGTDAVPGHYYLDDNDGDYYYAVCGGHYMEKAQTFLNNYPEQIQFLTWQRRTKYVLLDQPEFLYWIAPNSDCFNGYIRLKIYYTDATTFTQDFEWTISAVVAMYMPVGYKQIVAPFIDTEKVLLKWEIIVVSGDDSEPVVSGETFTYYPKTTELTPWNKYIVFRNSFNAYDTYRCIGVSDTNLDVTTEVLNKWLDADYTITDGEFENSESENRITHKIAVNFEEEEAMIDYLREIFVNPKAAILTYDEDADDGSYKAKPICINAGTLKIKRDDEMLYSFEFEYVDANFDTGIYEVL